MISNILEYYNSMAQEKALLIIIIVLDTFLQK